jgi:hypothetical protein
MTHGLSRCMASLLICGILIPADAQAQARPHAAFDGLGLGSKTTLVVVALTTAVALLGVGVYFAIRQGHTVRGCVTESANGLDLQMKDGSTYLLLGATSGIRAGEWVKVTGAKKKRVNGVTDQQSFVVDKIDKLDKDYGACSVSPARP